MSASNRMPILFPLETDSPDMIAKYTSENPGVLPRIFDFLEKDTTSRKFAYEKALRQISREFPELLYPHFERIAGLLEIKNSFIRWGAIITLSNLATIDMDGKSHLVIDRYLDLLVSDHMVDAANAADNLWKFVIHLPELDDKVTGALLSTSKHTHLHKKEPSPECGYIIMGCVLDCFSKYFEVSRHKQEMLDFAKAALTCPRAAVTKKAEAFLKSSIRG